MAEPIRAVIVTISAMHPPCVDIQAAATGVAARQKSEQDAQPTRPLFWQRRRVAVFEFPWRQVNRAELFQ